LLAKLKRKRVIEFERRDIVITDVDKLSRLANYDEVER
jgi:hypothetical protein